MTVLLGVEIVELQFTINRTTKTKLLVDLGQEKQTKRMLGTERAWPWPGVLVMEPQAIILGIHYLGCLHNSFCFSEIIHAINLSLNCDSISQSFTLKTFNQYIVFIIWI